MTLVAADVSHYQHLLDQSYTRGWIICKATQGTYYQDANWRVNDSTARAMHAAGKLDGLMAYHVFTGENVLDQFDKIKATIMAPGPHLAGVMIDLESWSGTSYALKGDHSQAVNQLGALLAEWLGGNWRRVWLYGNAYDLGYLAPRRDKRMPVILAAYTSELRLGTVGALGQQYSDGQNKWSVPNDPANGQQLPRSSQPFGNCDHNVFPNFANAAALRAWIDQEDDQMTPQDWQKVEALARKVAQEAIANYNTSLRAGDDAGHWDGDGPLSGINDRLHRLEMAQGIDKTGKKV